MQFTKKHNFYLLALLMLMISNNPYQVHSAEPVNVIIDGVVGVDEYHFSGTFEDYFTVYWSVSEDEIFMALQAETTGYVAIGFDPEIIMKNADLVYGSVDGDNVSVADMFSSSTFGPPETDISLGGTSDVFEYNGTEEGGVTTFEFKRLLSTGDPYDNTISLEGEVNIIWSADSSDDFSAKPSEKGSGTINFATGETKETYLIYYIIGGIVAILVIIILSIYLIKRKRKNKTPK